MFKKSFFLIIFVSAFLIGCGKKEGNKEQQPKTETATTNESVLHISGEEIKTLDPQINSSTFEGGVISNLYEGLMRDYNYKIVPGIAKSYDISDDGLTYTFHLRKSKWSDGKPLTANDFKYSWLRGLNGATASDYAFQLFYIKGGKDYFDGKISSDEVGIDVVDDYTLKVTLEKPTPYFINLTSFYTYFPVRADLIKEYGDSWATKADTTISNGPFKLTTLELDKKLVLTKNNNYWAKDEVGLDRIDIDIIGDSATALIAYDNSELDLLDVIPQSEIQKRLKEDPTFQILPMLGTYYYLFNTDKKPLDDVRVRKALSLGIDRRRLVDAITSGGEIPASGFIPPNLPDSSGNDFRKTAGNYYIDSDHHDKEVEEAKRLLSEAGFKDGKGFPTLTLLYNTSDSHKKIAEAIQIMWRDSLGINIKLENQEWAVAQSTIAQRNFDIARSSWIGDYTDPMTFLELFSSYHGKNNSGWNWKENPSLTASKDYDQLIEKSKEVSGSDRDKTLYELEGLLMDNLPLIPIYYYVDQVMVRDYVKGWYKNPLDTWYFGRAYIEKK